MKIKTDKPQCNYPLEDISPGTVVWNSACGFCIRARIQAKAVAISLETGVEVLATKGETFAIYPDAEVILIPKHI